MKIVLDQAVAATLLPRREEGQAKWLFGRTLLVCGSASMTGAALLSCEGALRSGAGLVQLASVDTVIAAARVRLPEALLLPLPQAEDAVPGAICRDASRLLLQEGKKAQSLLFGCGCGITDDGRALLQELCAEYDGTIVLDADGLNLLAENRTLLKNVRGRCILTPHAGEFCRLSGLTREQLESDPAGAAMAFAAKYGCVVALKGAVTYITDGRRHYTVDAPNSGMAKGGSGDVLAGLTAGLAARMGDRLLECAALAVWLHSCAGLLARAELGANAMLPRDVLTRLGQAFLELEP